MSAAERTRHEPEGTATPGLAEPRRPPEGRMEWVYLWHWPIRAMHWAAALSIVVLAVTGLYIGKPYFVPTGDPSSAYLMGWMRFLHFAAAGLLVATGIVRIYWLFAGNRYERWEALFPIRRRDWANLWSQLKHYLLIEQEAPRYLGHNPLQQLSYTALYAVTLVMVVTGFAMYGQANPGGFFYATFGWATGLFGHIQNVRFVHHVLTWVFLIFIPIHVYLTLRTDLLENTGTVSSIVSGGRYVPSDETYEDE
jgi:Ni/Fe-hydrogenase b-type cytochrome subunit